MQATGCLGVGLESDLPAGAKPTVIIHGEYRQSKLIMIINLMVILALIFVGSPVVQCSSKEL